MSHIIQKIDEYVIIGNNKPYTNVAYINDFNIDVNPNDLINLTCEFRWSNNSHVFSEWISLTIGELNTKIDYQTFNKFWIEFRATSLIDSEIVIDDITLDVEYIENYNSIPLPVLRQIDKDNAQSIIKPQNPLLNIYNQRATINLQKKMSMFVNQMFGHEVTYFRAEPNKRSRDVIFLEWTLFEYTNPKKIKVLVPNNEFPDNKFNFSSWGMDFEIPFEIHIDKSHWEYIFGKRTMPQKRDAIYFPLVNRMYKIDSSQIGRDFMQEPIFYKLSLVKMPIQSNIHQTDNIKNIIDEVTSDVQKLFGEEIDAEITATSNTLQTTDKTTTHDKVRDFIDSVDINKYIVSDRIDNAGTLIANYYYDFQELHMIQQYQTAVLYKEPINLTKDVDFSYSCWFNIPIVTELSKETKSITLVDCVATIEYTYAIPPNVQINDWIELTYQNIKIQGKIINIINTRNKFITEIEIPEYILQSVSNSNSDWITKSYTAYKISRRNLLNAHNGIKGINIDILNNTLLYIKLNATEYFHVISELIPNIWYGIVINISNSYSQLGIHVWKRRNITNSTTKLEPVHNHIINGIATENRTADKPYSIDSSNIKITNIRILNQTIEQEKHSLLLTQNIFTDSHIAIIIDNAIPRMRLPYIGNVK